MLCKMLRLLPALLLVFAIVSCARNDQPAPAEPTVPDTEVIVIAEDSPGVAFPPEQIAAPPERPVAYPAEMTEDERVVEGAQNEFNEDPSDGPHKDLSENPNYDPSDNESPYPSTGTSAIGIGGGISGGGGRAGSGGFSFRRARGGGGRPHDARNRAALEWLKDHQNNGGYWRADAFAEDSHRNSSLKPGDDAGDADEQVFVTALALQAFAGGGYDHKEGDYRNPVRTAILFLRKTQQNDGLFGDPAVESFRAHAAATGAIAEIYGLSGDAVLKPIADRAVQYILKQQHANSGWGEGGANLRDTAWAVMALKSASLAGLEVDAQAMKDAGAFLASRTQHEKGFAAVTPDVGETSTLPLSEAFWCAASLMSGARTHLDADLRSISKLLVEESALPGWEPAARDFTYWHFASYALYQVGGASWKTWEAGMSKALLENQRGYTETDKQAGHTSRETLDEHGSWDPLDDNTYGRVYSTAINTLNIQVYYRYLRGTETPKSDKDKDGVRDGLEFDGFVNGQQSRTSNAGRLMARKGRETVGEFPLRHTNVDAKVSGTLAGTTVTQTFTNPYNTAIEAIYTFPLPGDSAINQFVMQIGERRIIGLMRPRAEAVRAYREARARGYTASLLTQNRANVFTQNVANIESGGEVKVEITYYQSLKYQDGRFEYVFPMTLGPRYKGGNTEFEVEPTPESDPQDRDGLDDPEDFDVRALPPGMRSGMDIDLSIEIEAGMPIDITRTRSLAHEILVTMQREGNAIVELSKKDAIPNRDFVLRWGIAGKQPEVGVLTHNDARGKFLSLQVQPQLDPADADVTPRELTFIMDVSGSMSGDPSVMSREVISKVLDHLHPDDIFNIVYFAHGNGQLFDSPQPNTPENIAAAKTFLGKTRASGGTEMLAGLRRALNAEHDPRYLQVYAFFTDGYIGREYDIFNAIKNEGQEARFFSFGIGSSVNRKLIDGIAEHGQGKAIYCLPRDGEYAQGAVQEFYNAIDMPVLCDIEIDWNGLAVAQSYPSRFNDLFAAQPLTLTASYSGSGEHTIYVNGRVGARRVSYPVKLDLSADADNPAIATIWARTRIADLEREAVGKSDQRSYEDAITQTALDFNLMSKYTSFVAVDESRVMSDGAPVQVWQPVEMPENVLFKGDSRPAEKGRVFEVPNWGLKLSETNDGRVIVVEVKDGTPGARAGMQPGQVIEKINGIEVTTLDKLEALLLQTTAKIEVETSLKDQGQVVEAKFKLPELKEKK